MRLVTVTIVLALICWSCAGQQPESTPQPEADTQASHAMPDDAIHAGLGETAPAHEGMGGMMGGDHDMGLNTDLSLDPAIRSAWEGGVVEVAGEGMAPIAVELRFGEPTALGETGLTAEALVFIPDFVMGDDGITSRSAEVGNTALQVRITEEGVDDYVGWLFGTMPSIHPYPHEKYTVVLVEGLPAE
jgi:hypothetical protein